MNIFDVFDDLKKPKKVGQFYLDSLSGCHTVKLEDGCFARFELHPSNCPFSEYDYVIQATDGVCLGYAYLKTREMDVLIEMEVAQTDQTYFVALPKNKFLIAA